MRGPGAVAFLFINTVIFLVEAFEPENDPYKLFDKYDADTSGSINHAELEKLLLAREIAQDLDAESLAQMYTILSQRYWDYSSCCEFGKEELPASFDEYRLHLL